MVKILAAAIHLDCKPLKVPCVRTLKANYDNVCLSKFTLFDNIVAPIRILKTLGVDIFANSKFGSHWQLLDQEARTKFQDILEEQNFAYRVVARHIHQLPSMPSIGHRDVIICLIRRFLDQTEEQATVEDATVYLARSS